MSEELKPCPFCGGVAQAIAGDGPFYGRVQIDCSVCRNATYWWEEAVAVRLWNRRAALAPAQPSGWISVMHRLPTSNTWVLAHNGKWTGVAKYEVLAEWIDERWRDEHSEFVEKLGPTVTHWMPLPAAPSPTKDQT
ncbi:DUF551 domain-containing protein [Caballeronia sp. LZ035]|uniref:DUF551 domain-containing protein n=1 Tax=Caballeronia sp. LZ035 TaxID=3038568 RepID=UPI00285ACFF6|nr:DUF551 domain-containing protein [Caballeronia sp. LZ035]MDR5756976.1 DUF551 domain-containing protein [Caballeronia sp. LZ035]